MSRNKIFASRICFETFSGPYSDKYIRAFSGELPAKIRHK
jgi:hypothetical protein